ncbi:MAG: Phosphoenolpyruvate synthase/pyruvate phosphate dikinase [Parcubacteria group bacterium GW2011_GWA2_39_18]|nr:MAG: Phosphoenolpyruvate synthase/pyruvate phosphate dikinase [Parcubacteria group bacterium GW2011_GWA2_39_18]
MNKNNKIKWFWSHRRNTSLHHMSFIMHGLSGKGWLPAVNFYFDNQIVIGVPKKGAYIFYDKNQLSSIGMYKNIWKSIDNNPEFVNDFQKRTDELFGAVFFKCSLINESNLSLLSNKEIHNLYRFFIKAVMTAPIISVQLWGIEACLDDEYIIIKFLKKRLKELNKSKEMQFYKEMLSVNIGETVAFTEQKNFFQVACALKKSNAMSAFRKKNINNTCNELIRYPLENELINKHIDKYAWINTEYVSNKWTQKRWVVLFRDALLSKKSPKEKLEEMFKNFNHLNNERVKVIKELNPPGNVLHAINALSEFIAQRDWAKGYMTKFLLSHRLLLREISNRIGIKIDDLLNYSYMEIERYFNTGEIINKKEIENRKNNGFAILIKNGNFSLVSGKNKIKRVIKKNGISEPFKEMINRKYFKGLIASRGKITGKARVLEDASRLSEFKKGEIIVTYMTTMEFTPVFRDAAAVVTDEGGMSCHAAIVSREFKLPCIVGTKIATRVIRTGDNIEVNANTGMVSIITN